MYTTRFYMVLNIKFAVFLMTCLFIIVLFTQMEFALVRACADHLATAISARTRLLHLSSENS